MSPTLLTGPEDIQPWLLSLVRRAKKSNCYHILFPSTDAPSSHSSSSRHSSSSSSRHSSSSSSRSSSASSHLSGIEDRLQRETAGRLVRESVPGHIWAYMLTLVVHADELFADPALAVNMARIAAIRVSDAPVSDRDWCRLRYELKGAAADDYPSRTHFEQGQKWLHAVTKGYRRQSQVC